MKSHQGRQQQSKSNLKLVGFIIKDITTYCLNTTLQLKNYCDMIETYPSSHPISQRDKLMHVYEPGRLHDDIHSLQ